MHAAMIMLVDLYVRPTSAEAPRSRALIDKIFSLSGPDGGIVSGEDGVTVQRPLREGGREAWDMLRRLRDKAWQRAGLDPSVLWTEDDQVRAGVAKPLSEAEKNAQSFREDMILHAEAKTAAKISAHAVGVEYMVKASMTDSQATPEAGSGSQGATSRRPSLQNGSRQQEPAPFRFRVQKASSPEVPPVGSGNVGAAAAAPNAASGDIANCPSDVMSALVPPIPRSIPSFNPPMASPPITQLSDATVNTAVSDNFVPGSSNAPTPGVVGGATNFGLPNRENSIGHFDWAQWDAVFGQHVAVDDHIMDMDWEEEHPTTSERTHDMDLYDHQ
jgi:hypothetical protein